MADRPPPRYPGTYSPLQTQGQSNANIPIPKADRLAGRIGGPSSLPNSFEHIAATSSSYNTLIYPSDRPKYFMHFGIYNYSRTGLLEVGTLTPWRGGSNEINLPLSDTIVDVLEAKWEATPIDWKVGGLFEGIKGFSEQMKEVDNVNKNKQISEQIAATPQIAATRRAAVGSVFERAYLDAGPLGQRYGAINGVAPQQFVTVLFIGPEYKQFSFNWNFSPRNKEESETLRRIVNVFKKAMSPSLKYVLLWGYPCIFRIMFRPNNEQLYKFRPCVLKKIQVNWTPLGRSAFYNTVTPLPQGNKFGATEEGNPPEGCQLSVSFQEIEYWHQDVMSEFPERSMDLSQSADDFGGSIT